MISLGKKWFSLLDCGDQATLAKTQICCRIPSNQKLYVLLVT